MDKTTITRISAYLNLRPEGIADDYEHYVNGKLKELYPAAAVRLYSRPGQTNVRADAGATRQPEAEATLAELCDTEWWEEFTELQEREVGRVVWSADRTARGY